MNDVLTVYGSDGQPIPTVVELEIPDRIYRAIKAEAKRRDTTTGAVITDALREYIQGQ